MCARDDDADHPGIVTATFALGVVPSENCREFDEVAERIAAEEARSIRNRVCLVRGVSCLDEPATGGVEIIDHQA